MDQFIIRLEQKHNKPEQNIKTASRLCCQPQMPGLAVSYKKTAHLFGWAALTSIQESEAMPRANLMR